MNSVQYIIDISTRIITNGGLLVGFFLVFLESFIPILPLSVFVALNVNSFGFFEGVLITWIATSIGSIICYHYFYLNKALYNTILSLCQNILWIYMGMNIFLLNLI